MTNKQTATKPGPYPHEPLCKCCTERRVCNVCGGDVAYSMGGWCCTNHRCRFCHEKYCTSGGSTSIGHIALDPRRMN